MMKLTNEQRLMYITHPHPVFSEIYQVRKVLEGGCRFIQIRMKQGIDWEIAKAIISLCYAQRDNVRVCVNDNLAAALHHGASGVHLGQTDMPVGEARKLSRFYGRDNSFLIGATANTFDEICDAADERASYIGLGPFRQTETKFNLRPLLGLEGYRNILQKCKEAAIEIPIFAIGGIERNDISSLMETGISGIAVSGAILRAIDPTAETRRFLQLLNA